MDAIFIDGPRISPRLKDALVADLIVTEGRSRVSVPLHDWRDWTRHLGRQLGVDPENGPGDVDETLLFIILELDNVIREWPPRHDHTVYLELARAATKDMTPIELHATLLAGPAKWGSLKIRSDCRIDRLSAHLQPLLERALAAELHRVLAKWVEWDIRKLREPGRKARVLGGIAAAEPAPPVNSRRVPYHQRVPPGQRDRVVPLYQPPGRT